MNNTISFVGTEKIINTLVHKYEEYKDLSMNPYVDYCLKCPHFTILIYKSNKIVVQGDFDKKEFIQYGYVYNEIIDEITKVETTHTTNTKEWDITYSHIGSDEVGTGDYFGPIVVASAFVRDDQVEDLIKIGVKDSKKITDTFILKTVPSLLKKYPHKIKMISNEEYNNIYDDYNMNKMKAILHNDCLYELSLLTDCKRYVIDQFCSEENYNKYNKDNPHKLKDIVFITKGESHSASVALASMFARYTFLLKIKELEEKYKIKLMLGSSNDARDYANKLLDEKGMDFLKKICKTNFKTIGK